MFSRSSTIYYCPRKFDNISFAVSHQINIVDAHIERDTGGKNGNFVVSRGNLIFLFKLLILMRWMRVQKQIKNVYKSHCLMCAGPRMQLGENQKVVNIKCFIFFHASFARSQFHYYCYYFDMSWMCFVFKGFVREHTYTYVVLVKFGVRLYSDVRVLINSNALSHIAEEFSWSIWNEKQMHIYSE